MEKRKIGFKGELYQETSLEDYLEEWVLLKFRNGNSALGKLDGINRKEANLFPYQKATYDSDGNLVYIVSYSGLPDTYERMDIVGYRSSSEEEVLNFCKKMNRESCLGNLKERKEIFELERINQEIDNSKKKIILP